MKHQVKKTPHTVPEGEYLYSVDDLALFLKVCSGTARRLHQEGRFPVYRRGRKLMFRKDEVIAGLREDKKEKTPVGAGVEDKSCL